MRHSTIARKVVDKRVYTVSSGSPDQLDVLEKMLQYISYCCGVGHSCDIHLSVDGDGCASVHVAQKGGKDLSALSKEELDEMSNLSDPVKFSLGE